MPKQYYSTRTGKFYASRYQYDKERVQGLGFKNLREYYQAKPYRLVSTSKPSRKLSGVRGWFSENYDGYRPKHTPSLSEMGWETSEDIESDELTQWYWERHIEESREDMSWNSDLSTALILMGRRDPNARYDVGGTPKV